MKTITISWLCIGAITFIALLGISSVSAGVTSDTGWTLTLSGDHASSVTQGEYEKGINVEQSSNYFASVVDATGQVWDGMPLWRLVSRVNNIRSQDYSVIVTGTGGEAVTLPGSEIAGNDGFILANAKNGVPLGQSDPSYPLVLAGKGLPIDEMIPGVSSITLKLSDSH
nr:hypothetical protein [uncultured Methanospirillum sp.]